jgi:UDP-glucose 4-epimerase
VKGVESVVHLAAFFRGATPEQSHKVKVMGSERLATAALRAGVKQFIFIRTGTVYPPGSNRHAEDPDSPNPTAPANHYAASKLPGSRLYHSYHDYHDAGA